MCELFTIKTNLVKCSKIAIEVFSAANTDTTIDAIEETLDLHKSKKDQMVDIKNSKYINDFLISSSLVTKYNCNLYNLILETFTHNDKIPIIDIKDKVTLALGSMVSLVKQKQNNKSEYSITKNFLSTINQEMKSCSNENCKIKYVESIKNSKLSYSVPELMESYKCLNSLKYKNLCVFFLKSMFNFRNEHFTGEILKNLLIIFYNEEVSTDLRIESLNLILDKYMNVVESESEISPVLLNIILTLKKSMKANKNADEFSYYAKRLLLQKAKNNIKLR